LRRAVSDKRCEYPGCEAFALTDEEGFPVDCCYRHSLGNGFDNTLPNDGIIDWTAIKIAISGSRPVRLTWVEKDIALGMILASDGTLADGERLLGVCVAASRYHRSRRVRAARRIAEALNSTSKEARSA
jgi:hypothetical protein